MPFVYSIGSQKSGLSSADSLMTNRLANTLARPLASFNDEELLWRMLDGEEEAFDALYDRREGMVYQFALRMSGSVSLAEDVTQDVFISLIQNGDHFDPARGSLSAYLLGMTRNRVLTLLRREKHFVSLVKEDGVEEVSLAENLVLDADPLIELDRAERVEAVRQAILALPLHYREVVVCCNLQEMTYEQAAELIGCPVGTVRSRLNRARSLLVQRLVERLSPDLDQNERTAYAVE